MRHGEFKAGELIPGTRYRVLGLLGVGGMGTVYEVEHTELGKRFVLKALLSELSRRQDLVARLRNEQRALGRLEHPCIVAVTDAGMTSSEVPYFVMERLDGETLGARLKRMGCLGVDEALGIAIGVLEGLAAAHQIGVVHRDIKPQNIFLAARSGPKILDFGVAKVTDTSGAITARGVAVGTPRYMSPEQASGERVDGRSDVYAVGLLLFEGLTGRGPFDDARDANEMLLAQLSRVPPRLLGRVPGMTPELDQLLAELLAKDPDARPCDARAAAEALRGSRARLGEGAAVDAPSRSATVRLGALVPEAPTTHADGVAARHGGRARLGVTEDATTLARPAGLVGPNDTLIDERDPRSGASDSQSSSDAITAAATGNPSTRTEILPAAPAGAGDVPTHTRVPVTPTNGSRTLDPLPLPEPSNAAGAKRRPRLVPWLLAALGLVTAVVLVGALQTRSAVPAGAPPAPGARAMRNTAPLAVATATPPVETRPPGASVARPAPAPTPSASSPVAPPPATVLALAPKATAAPARAAPVRVKHTEKNAPSPRIPAGLPSSGL